MKIGPKIALFFFSFLMSYSNENIIIYEKGIDAYKKGQYDLAIQEFESIISSGWESSELYYNLGNAFYRKGVISGAVWAYESCLNLSPSHNNAKYNLKLTNLRVTDKIDLPEPPFYLLWYLKIKENFTVSEWINVSLFILLLISTISLLLKMYMISSIKYIYNIVSIVLFCSLFITMHSIWLSQSYKSGVIYIRETEVRSEPNNFSTYLFKVHEGLKVSINTILENWVEVELLDGKKGWIEINKIRLINYNN